MTADLSALIARLEAAEAGSRELDALVWKALNPRGEIAIKGAGRPGLVNWRCRIPGATIANSWTNPGRYTTSLDAALALAERVLPGWYFGVQQNRYVSPDMPDNWSAYLSAPRALDQGDIEGEAPTPALALCIAILRAKQGEG